MRSLLVFVAAFPLVAAGACGKSGQSGKVTSTDHYREGRSIGDVQVTMDATTDVVTVTFAAPAAGWKDPRGAKIPAGAPQAFVAQAACTLKATKGDDFAKINPGQTCTANGRTQTFTGGHVWVLNGVLNVSLSGDGGYDLLYPLLLDRDQALPAT